MLPVLMIVGCPRAGSPEVPPADEAPALPAEARSWYLRARVAEASGDPEEADRALEWVLRLDRPDPWAWVHVAEVHLERGDHSRARDEAAEALRRADLPAARRVEALSAAALGEPEALGLLEGAGSQPGVYGARARLLGMLGRAAEADVLLVTAGEGGEDLDRARAAVEVGRPDRADELARPWLDDPAWGPEALQVCVAAGSRRCSLTRVHAWARERPELVHDPRWRPALRELAEASADGALAEAVLRRGDVVPLVEWLRAHGRADEALAELEARVGASEEWLAALRADAALGRGDVAAVLELTAGSRHPTVAWVRAGALLERGDVEAALALVEDTATSPEDAELRVGRVLIAAGRTEEALERWQEAGLGAARARVLGDVASWESVLASDPDDVEARLALAELVPRRADELLAPHGCEPAVLAARARRLEGCPAEAAWALAADAAPGDSEIAAGRVAASAECAGG